VAFLGFGVALCPSIPFPYPHFFIFIPNSDTAEKVSVDFLVIALPVFGAEGFVEDIHVASSVLVQEHNRENLPLLRSSPFFETLSSAFYFIRSEGSNFFHRPFLSLI
jgi:hypothetical protein